MRSLRSRLIAAYLLATLVPFGATVWVTLTLIDRSLGYATTQELDRVSRTFERTVRQFYQRERESLRRDARAGGVRPSMYDAASAANDWPADVVAFWESGEAEGFDLAGDDGARLEYKQRVDGGGPSMRATSAAASR